MLYNWRIAFLQHVYNERVVLSLYLHIWLAYKFIQYAQAKITSKMVKYKPTTVTTDIKSAKKIS